MEGEIENVVEFIENLDKEIVIEVNFIEKKDFEKGPHMTIL